MASLTYSPRSRHPCRLQNKILPHDSTKSINNNTSIHMSNPSSSINKIDHNTKYEFDSYSTKSTNNNSPPPLPPPPKHLIYMLGGDSSIYSTPHGSPQQANTRKYIILNSPNSNTSNNNNNISVDYSPDLLHVSNISKHESSTTGSFRQTDSGVTNMGGSLIDSEQYEPNTIVT
uniref:Velvet domain-containing protein n=1 Tax=Schistosoma curassoni TaxID=6186 RepID=A0A183JXW6_9TREM